MDSEEDIIRLNLDQDRRAYQAQLLAEQEKESAKEPKRLGSGKFLGLLFISIVADAVEVMTLGTFGWFIGTAVDIILLIVFGFSVKKQFKNMALISLAEFIPGIDVLPFRTLYILLARFYFKTI